MVTAAINPFTIYSKQAQFRRSSAFVRGFVGGRGCGKTKIGSVDVIMRAKDGESYMGVSPSYPDFMDSVWPTFKQTAEELGVWIRGVQSPLPKVIFRTRDRGQAEIVFRTGERPEGLRGPSKAGLWIDEASIQQKDVFLLGQMTLRNRGRMGWVSMTFTPKGTKHWTFETFYEPLKSHEQRDGMCQVINDRWYRSRSNTELIHATSSENPFLPEEYVDLVSQNYSTSLAAQELEGLFVDLGGLMFRPEWFGVPVKEAPRIARRVRYWDKAGTDAIDNPDACYSAGVLMAWDQSSGLHYVEDVVRGQWSYKHRNETILRVAQEDYLKYGNEVLIAIEQEPASGGKESAQESQRQLAGFNVCIDIVSGKSSRIKEHQKLPGEAKIVRAQGLCAQAEAGNVRLVEGRWTSDWIDEIIAFPDYAICDQVDASSGAFNILHKKYGIVPSEGPTRMSYPKAEPERWGLQFTRPTRGRKR